MSMFSLILNYFINPLLLFINSVFYFCLFMFTYMSVKNYVPFYFNIFKFSAADAARQNKLINPKNNHFWWIFFLISLILMVIVYLYKYESINNLKNLLICLPNFLDYQTVNGSPELINTPIKTFNIPYFAYHGEIAGGSASDCAGILSLEIPVDYNRVVTIPDDISDLPDYVQKAIILLRTPENLLPEQITCLGLTIYNYYNTLPI
jgi:hypothetical protein